MMDIAPTLLELAGIKHPAPVWRGREVVPMRGRNLGPWLSGQRETVHEQDDTFGWELCGRAAIRKNHWKAVFIPFPKGTSAWQLYDLAKNPGETDDLAQQHPEILEELLQHWEKYCEETGVVPLQPELGERFHAAVEAQMKEGAWIELEYWKAGALDNGKENIESFRRQIEKVPDPRLKETTSVH